VVTKEDADSAVVIDMARNILGNPYADDEPPALPASPEDDAATQPAPDGGDLGVAGVLQVGGGPEADRANGDQKSGLGASAGADGSGATDGSDRSDGAEVTTGVPIGGVISDEADVDPAGEEGGTGADGTTGGSAVAPPDTGTTPVSDND
jgi:hypothetical protein